MRAFLAVLSYTALGAALGLALTMWAVVPVLGAGNVERMAALGRHIDAGARPDVVFLGTSVIVEGIDASVAASRLPDGWTAENWAINGCAIKEARLIVPKIAQAQPRYIVVSILPNDLGAPDDIIPEKAYGYGAGGFGAAWGDADPAALFPGLSPRSADAMRSSRVAQAMQFRTTPLDWMNRRVRDLLRPDVRRPGSTNWVAPYELEGGISGDRLDRHVAEAEAAIHARIGVGGDGGARALQAMVHEIVRGGSRAVVCLAPQHPALRERIGPILDQTSAMGAEIESRPEVIFFDASELLGQDGFADALHPNAAGRLAFSTAVGDLIAEVERSWGGR